MRADYPIWGKAKLVVLLRRRGWTVSESTAGRILKTLRDQGAVTPEDCPISCVSELGGS